MLFATIMLTSPAYANGKNIPVKCPSVASIVSVGLDSVDKFEGAIWTVSKRNSTYDTNENWTFAIMFVEAKTPEKALEKASKSLTVLVPMNQLPEPDDTGTHHLCWYQGNFQGDNIIGVAFNPPATLKSIMKLSFRKTID